MQSQSLVHVASWMKMPECALTLSGLAFLLLHEQVAPFWTEGICDVFHSGVYIIVAAITSLQV